MKQNMNKTHIDYFALENPISIDSLAGLIKISKWIIICYIFFTKILRDSTNFSIFFSLISFKISLTPSSILEETKAIS